MRFQLIRAGQVSLDRRMPLIGAPSVARAGKQRRPVDRSDGRLLLAAIDTTCCFSRVFASFGQLLRHCSGRVKFRCQINQTSVATTNYTHLALEVALL